MQTPNLHPLELNFDEIVGRIQVDLKSTDRLRRKHASFWNFCRKGPEELAVFTEAIRRIEQDLSARITSWSIPTPDPPDIVVNCGEKAIGVEITELVNFKALEAQLHKPERYAAELTQYGESEAKLDLRRIFAEKEEKLKPVIDRYDAFVLLIHTAEPALAYDQFRDWQLKIRSSTFSRTYLLFPYECVHKECPLVCIQHQ